MIRGLAITVNVSFDSAQPAGWASRIGPVTAPTGTATLSSWSRTRVGAPAATPPKVTPSVPVNPVPSRITQAPTGPSDGLKPVTVGWTSTLKSGPEGLTPAPVRTLTGPEPAAGGTTARTSESETATGAGSVTPPKETSVTPARFRP